MHPLREVAPLGNANEDVCGELLVFLQHITYANCSGFGRSGCQYHVQTGTTFPDRQWLRVQTGSSHCLEPGSNQSKQRLNRLLESTTCICLSGLHGECAPKDKE